MNLHLNTQKMNSLDWIKTDQINKLVNLLCEEEAFLSGFFFFRLVSEGEPHRAAEKSESSSSLVESVYDMYCLCMLSLFCWLLHKIKKPTITFAGFSFGGFSLSFSFFCRERYVLNRPKCTPLKITLYSYFCPTCLQLQPRRVHQHTSPPSGN